MARIAEGTGRFDMSPLSNALPYSMRWKLRIVYMLTKMIQV
jgi:hypothetical protein